MFNRDEARRQNENKRVVSRQEAKVAGTSMAAPNQKALIAANNKNRRALGDIGNLVGALNTRCVISKDGVAERAGANLAVNASSSSQHPQAEPVAVRAETKAEADAVWGNKQKRTSRGRAQCIPVPEKWPVTDSSTDSTATEEVFKTASQHKTGKPRLKTFSASLTAISKDASKDLIPNIDDGDLENQLAVVEYVEDIYKFYRDIENLSCVPPCYMSGQLEINDKMRGILIDWLIEVHFKFELMPETLYLTVNVVDRYLSIENITRNRLQLVGITAMLIACKYEEIWAPEINDFVSISAKEYTRETIVDMERTMLNRLKFYLTVPTPYVFVVRFLKAADFDKEMQDLTFFFAELSLLNYVMIKYSPSMLAAASVYAARCTQKKDPCWTRTLCLHTGYSEEDLKECANRIVKFHKDAHESRLKVVHKKYSNPFYNSVALLSPANIPADDRGSSSN